MKRNRSLDRPHTYPATEEQRRSLDQRRRVARQVENRRRGHDETEAWNPYERGDFEPGSLFDRRRSR